jgi:hypothetical protein
VAEDPGGGDIRAALAAQLLQLRPRDLLAQRGQFVAQGVVLRGIGELGWSDRAESRKRTDAGWGRAARRERIAVI